MTARVLSGKEAAAALRAEVATRITRLASNGVTVGLATVLVGNDAASQVYVKGKHRAAGEIGIESFDHHLPSSASQEEVEGLIEELNMDDRVHGMIVQLPLPAALDGQAVVEAVSPAKDADGLHPYNLGRLVLGQPGPTPATPYGIMRLLDHYAIETAGALAVVVGRSFLVGRPLALLLGAKGRDATVVQAHSRTTDLAALTGRADILVAAVGRPGFFGADAVKPGATVVDVGITRTAEGLVGDVAFDEVAEVAGAVTPVPGGVGPMTIAGLLQNTVSLAETTLGLG